MHTTPLPSCKAAKSRVKQTKHIVSCESNSHMQEIQDVATGRRLQLSAFTLLALGAGRPDSREALTGRFADLRRPLDPCFLVVFADKDVAGKGM